MSNKTKKLKTVQVKESDLVTLMDNIVKEAVKAERKKIVAEHAVKADKDANLLEARIAKLEKGLKG